MTIHIAAVSPPELPAVWSSVTPLLERALAREPLWNLGALEQMLRAGHAQLWTATNGDGISAALVTRIVIYPAGRLCDLTWCAGAEPGDWAEALGPIEAWAKGQGCRGMEIIGRPGWERRLRGFHRSSVILRKDF